VPIYVPDRGDFIWVNFTPQTGHEQTGKRPALVLSPKEYNGKTGLLIACPVTSKEKGYPFEVKVNGIKIKGVILSDQVKSLDWKAREASFAETAADPVLFETQSKLLLLIE
jgi:mRNA interferase MazF